MTEDWRYLQWLLGPQYSLLLNPQNVLPPLPTSSKSRSSMPSSNLTGWFKCPSGALSKCVAWLPGCNFFWKDSSSLGFFVFHCPHLSLIPFHFITHYCPCCPGSSGSQWPSPCSHSTPHNSKVSKIRSLQKIPQILSHLHFVPKFKLYFPLLK